MQIGWIKLHRKILDSRLFSNEGLFKVWIYCLLRANYHDSWWTVPVGRTETEVFVKRGQFIFGRKSAAKKLKMKPSTLWKRMEKLKDMRNIDIESNTNFSLVSVIKYDSYQGLENNGGTESNHRGTTGEPLGNTYKNVKKDENEKEEKDLREKSEFDQFFSHYPSQRRKDRPDAWAAWKQTRKDRPTTPLLLEALDRHKRQDSWQNNNGKFIPYPANWLRALSWNDEIEQSGQAETSDYLDKVRKEAEAKANAEGEA